jgi:energy-coupling factor transport system ATP-binding protein
MAMEPQVLVLDEPTAGLDPQGRERILQMIQRYRAQTGKTVLLISHSMEDVARLADRVLVLQQGRIAMHGSVAQVFARAQELINMGLTVPGVTRIFLALKRAGVPVNTGVYTLAQGKSELAASVLNADLRR